MDAIAPVSGWVLDQIAWLDEAHSGFAGHHLAAHLSVISVPDEDRGEAACFLSSADHQSILRTAFGKVPSGLRRALAKSGASPWGKSYYRRLYDLLASDDPRVVEAIRHSNTLDPERLSIIEALAGKLCDSRIVNRITTSIEATDLTLVADLLERRGIERDAFVEALCRLPVSATVQRWSLRLPFPSGPIPTCAGYRPVMDGVMLKRLARKYRNCMHGYLPNLIAGDHAFGEFHIDEQDVLISFDRSAGY